MVVGGGGACITKPGDFAALLLSKGAKKDAVDDKGRTALARATEEKNTAVIELLKKVAAVVQICATQKALSSVSILR